MSDKPASYPTSAFTLSCATMFCGFMGVGAWQMQAAARHEAGLNFPTGWASFRNGSMTQGLEKQLEHHMPLRQDLITAANSARFVLLRGAGDQVRIGRDGWLFLTEELRHWSDASGAQTPEHWFEQRMNLIAEVASRLERQDVRLLVALVPDKARVNQHRLDNGSYPSYNDQRYAAALEALARHRVETADLLVPLSKAAAHTEVYYRTDTHWNQAGARLAADTLAARIRAQNLELESVSFETKIVAPAQSRTGDLIRLMGLEKAPQSVQPRPDLEAPAQTVQSQTAGASLFGDPQTSVVLAGTSYSLRGNFHGYLQERLGARVLNTAKDGGGFLQALTAYLKDDAFRSSKPKLLVWEIPERLLSMPLAEEKDWLRAINEVLPQSVVTARNGER